MALPTLKITSPSATGRDTQVWLDGHEITHGITSLTLTLDSDPREMNRVEISFAVDRVEVDAETLAALEAHVEATSGVRPVDIRGFGQVA